MTQEELDALMAGGLDALEDDDDGGEEAAEEEVLDEEIIEEEEVVEETPSDLRNRNEEEEIYPPPATDDHQVVSQLDQVTEESELKAGEVLDMIDAISNSIMEGEEKLNTILSFLEKQKSLLEKLHTKFPHIKVFENDLNEIDDIIAVANEAIEGAQGSGDSAMMAMDAMQYQDIHRQKIERVINIMRALIKYMNRLFEGKVSDEKRVRSATHIHGDTTTDEVVEEDDIEALIAQFGQK